MGDPNQIRMPRPATGSGIYHYRLNGANPGVQETFAVTEAGYQAWSVRLAPGGLVLRVEAEWAEETNLRCHLSLNSDAVDLVEADYTVGAGTLLVQRRDSQGETETTVDGGGVLSPLLRVFQGPAIAETIRAGGEERVIVPALDPTDVAGLLMPTVQVRTAERLGVEVGERDSGQQPLRHCRYIGGSYDDAADFWLDDHDRLARYRFPQAPGQVWEVTLATGE
jgi:hypothetical protein